MGQWQAQTRMRQDEIVTRLEKSQLVTQSSFVFAQRVDPPPNSGDMLAEVQVQALHKCGIGEYCLSNHIECEDLRDVPMNPAPGKQRHGQLHHVLGLGDNDRLPFEAAKPMPLAAMIPLEPIRPGFAHDQALGWDHRGLHRPRISTVERHLPWGQASDQLLQGCRITTPALPVKEAACITIKSLPDPEVAPFF
jgi:hypothetical protein